MFKKCLTNRITRKDEDYKCYLCHHVMKQSSFAVVEEHMVSEKHQERLNQIDQNHREKELEKLSTLTGPERKRLVDNSITLDRISYLVNCHVCKCRVNGLSNTLEHIEGLLHKRNLKNLNKQNKDTAVEQKVNELPCDKINTNKTADTLNFQASISPLQADSNGIICNEQNNSHYCNICKMRIIATPNISQHTQGLLHQALESKLKALNPNSKSDYIVFNEKCNSYECTICKCKLISTPNVTQHIQGFMHQTMLKAHNAIKTKSVNRASQELLNQTSWRTQNQEKGLAEQMNFKSHFTKVYNCKTCQVSINKFIVLKYHMVLHLYEEFDSLKNFDLIKFESKSNNKLRLECLLCNSFICESDIKYADQALGKHLETEMHLDRLALFDYDGTKCNFRIPPMNDQLNDVNLEITSKHMKNISPQLLCNFCDVPVPLKNEENHALGKSHVKKVLESQKTTSNLYKVKKPAIILKENSDHYICFICDKSFPESPDLLEHFKTLKHQLKIISLNMINKSPYMELRKQIKKKSREVIYCMACKTSMYSFVTSFQHMIGKKHKEEIKLPSSNLKNLNTALLAKVTDKFQKMSVNPTNAASKNSANSAEKQNLPVIKTKNVKKVKVVHKLEASIEELNLLGFSTENIQPLTNLNPDMADDLLGDLVALDFNKSQTRRLPSNAKVKSPRTPKIEDQRNSFATNVLRYGKTFIKFCIDPGQENIFNLDDEQISLMKFGVPLTFPFHSDRVCIPCGEQFPNDVQSLFEHIQNQEHLKNISNMMVDDKEFAKFPEQFSDLRLARSYMHLSDEFIQCYACNVEIEDNDDIIRRHVKMLAHEKKSKLWKEESEQMFDQYLTIYKDVWYYAENFFCEICKNRSDLEIDFAMHLIHPEHMKKVYELKHKGTALKFDLCPPCTTYWFGKADSYQVHCKNDYHKLLVNKKDFEVPNLTKPAFECLDGVDTSVELLVAQSDKADLEKDKVTELLEAIVEAVKPTYPDAKAFVFGSRLSQLGFPDSDVDIFLDCENVYHRSSTKKQSQEYIESVKSYFDNNPDAWKMDEVLKATRVPILKMRHIPTNLHCDISFVNGLSVEKSKLIGIYNRAFPICRKLILFMKKWLTLCRLSGPDCITTFAISWCVIFYLQLKGILPSVHELIQRKMKSKIVDAWECGFDEIIVAESSNLSFKEHLKGFFTYFANFDYQKSVVCPYLSKTIDKHTFAYTDQLPSEMDIYKRRLKDEQVEIFRFDSPMCIQDPIDLSQNLTKALSKKHLRRFRQHCNSSAEKC